MTEEISKSKQKRLAIKEAKKKARNKKLLNTLLAIVIPVAILAIIVAIVFYQRKVTIENTLDYGKYLAEDGTIANISIDDYITFNYEDMSFSKAELLPSDETVNADIDNLVASYAHIPDGDTAISKVGDRVNVTYTATIDGEVYNAVDDASGGADFTIGDAVISEDFDKALTSHKKGDTFVAEVAYADDYSVESLAGKTVVYDIKFNGVYVIPEFDDTFVQEHMSSQASSADEYRVMLVNNYYEQNLSNAITESLSANYVVHKLPTEYVENDKKGLMAQTKEQFKYYNEMYAQYGMAPMKNVYEMYGFASDEELDAMITESAEEETRNLLAFQYVYVHAGLSNTPDDVKAYFTQIGYSDEEYNNYLNDYGYNYLACAALQGRTLEYLVETVNVTP